MLDISRVLLAILYFLMICTFIPMDVYITASYPQGEGVLVSVGPFLGLLRFGIFRRSLIRETGPPARSKVRVKRPAVLSRNIRAFIIDILRSGGILMRKLDLDIILGTGDAAYTGMAIGGIWAAMSPVIHVIMRTLPVGTAPPRIRIIPDFQTARIEGDVSCIARLNLGYIILRAAVFGAGYALRRVSKGKQTRR